MKTDFHRLAGALRRWRIGAGCAVALAAFASPLAAGGGPADDPLAALVAAERGFAADAARNGIGAAFRAHAAADSILLRPDPRPALAQLAQEADVPGLRLEWQPAMAAVSRSNDLGFTSGPYRMIRADEVLHGQYLTIWQRGEGGWRWYLDHGLPPVPEERPTVFPADVRRFSLPAGDAAAPAVGSPLAETEDALNEAIVAHGWTAIGGLLAEDGYLFRPRRGVVARADALGILGGMPGFTSVERLGMRVAQAGDLAASYGRLKREGDARAAYYVRIWRRERTGWRLLIDQVT